MNALVRTRTRALALLFFLLERREHISARPMMGEKEHRSAAQARRADAEKRSPRDPLSSKEQARLEKTASALSPLLLHLSLLLSLLSLSRCALSSPPPPASPHRGEHGGRTCRRRRLKWSVAALGLREASCSRGTLEGALDRACRRSAKKKKKNEKKIQAALFCCCLPLWRENEEKKLVPPPLFSVFLRKVFSLALSALSLRDRTSRPRAPGSSLSIAPSLYTSRQRRGKGNERSSHTRKKGGRGKSTTVIDVFFSIQPPATLFCLFPKHSLHSLKWPRTPSGARFPWPRASAETNSATTARPEGGWSQGASEKKVSSLFFFRFLLSISTSSSPCSSLSHLPLLLLALFFFPKKQDRPRPSHRRR